MREVGEEIHNPHLYRAVGGCYQALMTGLVNSRASLGPIRTGSGLSYLVMNAARGDPVIKKRGRLIPRRPGEVRLEEGVRGAIPE